MANNWQLISDAIVTSINAATFSQPFTAVRTYRPTLDLEVLESETEPRVIVSPAQRTSEIKARKPVQQRDYFIAVQVIKYTGDPADNALNDPWADLAEEIENHLMRIEMMDCGTWMNSDDDPSFEFDELLTLHCFTTAIIVQYRVKVE